MKVMELDLYPKFVKIVQETREKESARVGLIHLANDENQFASLLEFVSNKHQRNDLLFWCLAQRFRVEADAVTQSKLGVYLMRKYVCAGAVCLISGGKEKIRACRNLYLEKLNEKQRLPGDLYDSLVHDIQITVETRLLPAYRKSLRSSRKRFSTLSRSKSTKRVFESEIEEAMKERDFL